MDSDERFPLTWFDGQIHEAGRGIGLSPSDHGVTVGDGAFETIRILHGRAFAVDQHMDRLAASLSGLGIREPNLAVVRSAIDSVAEGSALADGRLRVTVTAGTSPLSSVRGVGQPTVLVAAEPSTPVAELESLVTCPWTRNERGVLAGIKSTSYADNVIALAWAKARGAGDAIFHNTQGHISEGTGSNLFALIDGVLVTPPIGSSGCLAGITRSIVLDLSR